MARTDDDSLRSSLETLPLDARRLLEQHRFDPEFLVTQAALSRSGEERNLVRGKLTVPDEGDVPDLSELSDEDRSRYRKLGEEALSQGQCALVVLAGGMATRMGGVIKALVEALPGKSFLDLRLAEQHALGERYGARPPLWLMTSHATHEGIAAALGERVDGKELALFRQGLSVRLTEELSPFLDENEQPSLHAPGHGDLPSSLQASGLIQDFVARGGRYVLVTNLDNLGGGLDPVLIGMHLSQDCSVTCEVVEKVGTDKGGIPVNLNGKLVVLEEFRIPPSFDPKDVPVFNVNSFAFNAKELERLQMDWTYFEVHKKVGGQPVIQYERLINEVSFALPTSYVKVPREGAASRFLPVKDFNELEARRKDIEALARARGMTT